MKDLQRILSSGMSSTFCEHTSLLILLLPEASILTPPSTFKQAEPIQLFLDLKPLDQDTKQAPHVFDKMSLDQLHNTLYFVNSKSKSKMELRLVIILIDTAKWSILLHGSVECFTKAVGKHGTYLKTSILPCAGFGCCTPVPIISVAVRYFGRYLRELSHATQAAAAVAASIAESTKIYLHESFGAIRTVRSFAQESYAISTYSEKVDETLNLGLQQAVRPI
ncbi:hypothetical protein L2E82_51255 [Cichorium intybus]|nr:hypothetical protein L2E82_51255 [Cichorium intybus]